MQTSLYGNICFCVSYVLEINGERAVTAAVCVLIIMCLCVLIIIKLCVVCVSVCRHSLLIFLHCHLCVSVLPVCKGMKCRASCGVLFVVCKALFASVGSRNEMLCMFPNE